MKKIISALAMALLVIGAAQAQEQVRRMVVNLTNGQVVKYDTKYVEDVTFEIIDFPDVPTTIDEAKAMLAGYWRINVTEDDDEIEGNYFVITDNLEVLLCIKVKDSVTDGSLAPYAGKYIAYYEIGEVTFPNEEDPTTFYLGSELNFGTNLQFDSFDYNLYDDGVITTFPCVRVEPFEYIRLGYDLMKNGLMKK